MLLPDRHRVNAGDNVLHLSGLSWAGRYGLRGRGRTPPARGGGLRRGAAGATQCVRGAGGLHRWLLHVLRRRRPGLACPARRLGGAVLSGGQGRARLRVPEGQLQVALPRAKPMVVLAGPSSSCGRWSRSLPLLARRRGRDLGLAPLSDGWLEAKLDAYAALWADRRACTPAVARCPAPTHVSATGRSSSG